MGVHVTRAGFAPMKGTRHTAYAEVRLDPLGPVGDRRFCAVDADRHRVLRTMQHPELVALVARVEGGELVVDLPDGAAHSWSTSPGGEDLTCDYWGRAVRLGLLDGDTSALAAYAEVPGLRLALAPPAQVVYGAPVSIVTTASLADLSTRTGRTAQAERFRPTFVVETDEAYAEDGWTGRRLRIGEAEVEVRGAIPRCVVIDLDPVTGRKDGSLLRALAGHRPTNPSREPWFGVDASVVQPGTVRPGDRVSVVD